MKMIDEESYQSCLTVIARYTVSIGPSHVARLLPCVPRKMYELRWPEAIMFSPSGKLPLGKLSISIYRLGKVSIR
jgi:hypothetical protein